MGRTVKNVKIECVETGYQEVMTLSAFYERFGEWEGKEMLAGYDSIMLAFETDEPVNSSLPNFLNRVL